MDAETSTLLQVVGDVLFIHFQHAIFTLAAQTRHRITAREKEPKMPEQKRNGKGNGDQKAMIALKTIPTQQV